MRKILVSLLVVSMLLGLVGTASAAAFSDTAGNKYTDKVAAYGWMGGYPDGTFKPAGNITRAEVAAVLVRALGLEPAASAAAGLGSKFTDVAATHWAAGYVNVCTSKGIIKGYADGTFKPEANVTNAEVITMIVRALNREALAVGDWPVGHITAAVDAGIIGTGFAASVLATRENVATYVAKASTKDFYKLTAAGWEVDDTKSFVELCDFTKGAAVTLTSFTSTTLTAGAEKDLAADFRVAGGKELKDLIGCQVFLTTNADGEVVLLETDTTFTTKTGTVDYTVGNTALYLEDDTTKYTMDNDFDVYINGVKSLADANLLTNVGGDIEMQIAAGVVEVIKLTDYDVPDVVVTSVYSSGPAAGWTLTAGGNIYSVASDAIITKNGVTVTFADIKADDVVKLATTGANVIKFLTATDKTVSGKVTATRTVVTTGNVYYLSVDGVEYRAVNQAAMNGAVIGNTVTLTLGNTGRIFATEIDAASTQYAKITSFILGATSTTYDKWVVDVKGVATTYEVGKTAGGVSLQGTLDDTMAVGNYVRLTLDENGRVTTGTELVDDYVAKAVGASFIKVSKVYTADKLAVIAQTYGDVEADPDDNRETISSTYVTIPDTAIVYINGTYAGSGIANVAAGSFIEYVLVSGKAEFILIDSAVTYVAGKVTIGDDAVTGIDGAISENSDLYLYETADFTLDPVVGTVNAGGDFTIDFPDTVASGEACYLKIVDPYGVFTTVTVVRP